MKTKAESMKRNLVLLAFGLSLLITPFGGAGLLVPVTKVVAQESDHAAMNMSHTAVVSVKSVVERTVYNNP